jgi:hypothetical protein
MLKFKCRAVLPAPIVVDFALVDQLSLPWALALNVSLFCERLRVHVFGALGWRGLARRMRYCLGTARGTGAGSLSALGRTERAQVCMQAAARG